MKLFILLVHYVMHLESGIVYNIAFKLKDMLEKKIQEDLFEAMKSHDETRVSALRAVKTAIQNEKTNGKFHELTEADIVKIVQKQIKQREEAENIYREAGREELANKEQNERLVLEIYVPKMLAESEVKKIVDQLVVELNATSMKDMGRVMAELNKRYTGSIDGKIASTLIKNKLMS